MMTKNYTAKGFTIIELLIVVVMIAILAAITIVSYNGITSSARDSSLQSGIATLDKKFLIKEAEGAAAIPPQGVVTNKDSFVTYYNLQGMEGVLAYRDDEAMGDKTKIHVRAVSNSIITSCYPTTLAYSPEASFVEWSYWNTSESRWIQTTKFGNKERALSVLEFVYEPSDDHYFSSTYYDGVACD